MKNPTFQGNPILSRGKTILAILLMAITFPLFPIWLWLIELDKMRANAMAASNYVVFARDNFMLAKDERKREIAHSLGFTYKFYGREKKIEVEVHPLLVEVVGFAKHLEKALELEITGYTKEKTGSLQPALSSGGPTCPKLEHLHLVYV